MLAHIGSQCDEQRRAQTIDDRAPARFGGLHISSVVRRRLRCSTEMSA
jgi:hypothetical protein